MSSVGSLRGMSWRAPDILQASMDYASVAKRLNAYERLMRLDKPVGGLLLLRLWRQQPVG